MPANIRSFTFPLAQDLPQRRHTDGFLFSCFSEGVDLPRKSLCAFSIRLSSLQGPVGGSASWSGGPHGQIPPAQTGPLCFPLALGSQWHWCTKAVSPGLCRVTPQHTLLPRRQAGDCREQKQLSKAASSARLMTKELHHIREIGSLICYIFKMACDATG